MKIEELKAKATQELAIPGFTDDEPVTVRVRKPRLMAMMAQGKIPNPLLGVVTNLLNGKGAGGKNTDFAEMAKLLAFFCATCLVEPAYEEMQDIITDQQMMAICNWAVGDVMQMSSFRPDAKDGDNNQHGKDVSDKTK